MVVKTRKFNFQYPIDTGKVFDHVNTSARQIGGHDFAYLCFLPDANFQ